MTIETNTITALTAAGISPDYAEMIASKYLHLRIVMEQCEDSTSIDPNAMHAIKYAAKDLADVVEDATDWWLIAACA